MAFPLLDIVNIGMKIVDRIIPDPAAKAAAQLELIKLQQTGELATLDADLKLQMGQVDINKIEAASSDPYASSWRPTVGYICCIGLFYSFLFQPLFAWFSSNHNYAIPPALPSNELYTLVFSMLGLGGLRSFDKLQGTDPKKDKTG